jgi:hypothetical protein
MYVVSGHEGGLFRRLSDHMILRVDWSIIDQAIRSIGLLAIKSTREYKGSI